MMDPGLLAGIVENNRLAMLEKGYTPQEIIRATSEIFKECGVPIPTH